jgi:hypothetical protein
MMKPSLALALVLAAVPVHAAPAADAKIRACFDRYKKAAAASDGATAAKELDANTVAYYAQLRTAALSAPDIHGLAPPDKLMVLRIRMELSPDQLSALDGRSLIAYAIGKRWANSAQIGAATLGKIALDGKKAETEMLMGGRPSGAKVIFRQEGNDWRLDLAANNENNKIAFMSMRRNSKLSEDELILKMLKDITGQTPPDKVWQPLVPTIRR